MLKTLQNYSKKNEHTHLNIQMFKIIRTLIKVGERMYATYANCRTLQYLTHTFRITQNG